MKAATKTDDSFTTFQFKTENPTNIEISTSISLEVSLFWCRRTQELEVPNH